VVTADLPSDHSAGESTIDFAPGDAFFTQATVMYAAATAADVFAVRTVSSTGQSKPQVVPGWNGFIGFEPLSLTSLQEHVPLSPDRPRVTQEEPAPFRGIGLPGGLGTLHYFHRKLLGTSGLLVVSPQGALSVLFEIPGIYASTLGGHVALDTTGKIGAAVRGAAEVRLFRTDGSTFAAGSPWTDVSAKVLPLVQVRPASLTIGAGWLYCIGQDSSSKDHLLRAPLDGSATLVEVPLPPSGGQVPVLMGDQMASSTDGTRLALAAGAGASQQDLYAVAVASGSATNVTSAPGQLAERGNDFGDVTGLLALSPQGTLVAYVKLVQGMDEVFVARTDGGQAPVQVTKDSQFQPQAAVFSNLHFPDENTLLFMAGTTVGEQDVYRWDHAQGTATNVTATGSTTSPFAGQGRLWPKAGWVSPGAKWLYLIAQEVASQDVNLFAVSLGSFSSVKVTSKIQIQAQPGLITACPGNGMVYFVAKPDPSLYANEVWAFDQNTAQPAAKLTTMSPGGTTPWVVQSLTLSQGCTHLAWSAGGSAQLRDLWVLSTSSPGAAKKLTATPSFVGSSLALTPGADRVIYGSGGTQTTTTLKSIPTFGGTPVVLDAAPGALHLFSVY
jgi:hypothetical protein